MKTGSTFILIANLDINMDYVNDIIFTIKCGSRKITKTEYEYNNENKRFEIPLNQEDTIQLEGRCLVEAQINFTDNSVAKSEIGTIYVNETLATKIIDGNQATKEGTGVDLDIDGNIIYGGNYILPVAKSYELGGVMPIEKTEEMTKEVGVDEIGRLYTKSGGEIDVDSYLSETSTNPVQNAVITKKFKEKLDRSGFEANKILGTDAEGNVIAKDAEAEVDLTDYVKNTDYASSEKAGIVKVISNQGIEMDGEVISISPANRQTIDTKASYRMPIVPAHLDYAVMKALSDSKYAWTEEEKLNSRNLLGATGEDQILQFAIKPTTEKASFHNIQDSADYKILDFGMEGKTEQDTTSGNNLLDPNAEHWEMQKSLNWGAMAGTEVGASNRICSAFTILHAKPNISMSFLNNTTNKYWVDRIIEADENGLGYVNHRLYDDASTQNKKNYLFTTNENTTRLYVQVRLLDNTKTFTETDLGKMRISVGYGNITSYEPYTGGQPSPNPEYPQEIVNAGKLNEETGRYEIECEFMWKNLLNISRNVTTDSCFIQEDGSIKSDISNYYFATITISDEILNNILLKQKGKTVTISVKEPVTNKKISILIYGERTDGFSYQETRGSNGQNHFSFVLSDTFTKIKSIDIRLNRSNEKFTDTETVFTELMLNIGEYTKYEPFQSQNITLTSPVPLTKWDKLVKRDGVYGWSINGVIIALNGSKSWTFNEDLHSFYFRTLIDSVRNAGNCTHYRNGNVVIDNDYVFQSGAGSYADSLWIKDLRFNNVFDFKAWITENNVTVTLQTDEEQAFYPLPDSEQTLLNNLETYYGVTNIYNDQGCPMWLTYVADTKLYIDNKILSIQTAMI